MKRIFEWLYRKRNEDNALTQFLKLGYALGRITWLHTVVSAGLGIAIPIFYEMGNMYLFWGFISIMVIDILFVALCNSYQKSLYTKRQFSSSLLLEQSSLLKSIVIEIENNKNWKNTIFKTVSELVCEIIYRSFKEILNCETRISIEYIFNKQSRSSASSERYVKMSGRRSHQRSTVKKSMPLNRRNKYFSYQIFANNNCGINILEESQINNASVWYKNPNNNVDVKRYIGIAVSIYDDTDVKFILQIDCLDDINFGDNNSDEDIKNFIEQYLMSYINIVSLSYLLNLNNKKEIAEV